ncbi:MAG: sn-glycerol-1-phosphate dehydrogenase, partial [Firmicutes bacterium]|nr:sn-glycerol-1-phosphate dehydrogenase [Bacillota bacterium]
MKIYDTPHKLNDYLDTHFTCDCGKEHYASLKTVSIGKGALETIPQIVKDLGFSSLYLVSDSITYDIAGKRTMEILEAAGIKAKIVTLTHTGFDEATVGELVINMPLDCDVVIAVGTGSINDMTRFFSHRMGRPFFTVATAAPMDGFASSIAAINVNSLKTTYDAQTPVAIIGDTDILKGAPYRMIAAGLGDLLGKYTCLCDWKIAKLINDEHYCPTLVELVENCIQGVLKDAGKAASRDPEVLGNIMEGLVLTGVAMSLYGNSRPASGCEHHMSHYWEMMFEQAGKRPVPHGTQVSVGTVLILKLVEALKATNVDFNAAREAAKAYDQAQWEADIRAAYG